MSFDCFRSGVAGDFVLLEHDLAAQGNGNLTFQGKVFFSSSRVKSPTFRGKVVYLSSEVKMSKREFYP